jgi:hypothetical protein
MADDISILRSAYEQETDTRRPPKFRHWEAWAVGANKDDVERLMNGGFVEIQNKDRCGRFTKYVLTDKGRGMIAATMVEEEATRVRAEDVLAAFEFIVGFGDIKEIIAQSIEARRRTHFLFCGPPACAKSLFLEGIRAAVPSAMVALGSRTTAAGISDQLFETRPRWWCFDEIEKATRECFSVMLALMQNGEVIEVKFKKSRGIKLDTQVFAACNSTNKLTPELISRFGAPFFLREYTRAEFIDVCIGFLCRSAGAPEEIAQMIAEEVYDHQLGDVRRVRGIWDLMLEPTVSEVRRIINVGIKYSEEVTPTKKRPITAGARLF